MKSIFAKKFSRIDLGRRGEHLARQIVFDLAEWQMLYGNGKAELLAQLPGSETPYPCPVAIDQKYLIWQIRNADTQNVGKGKCELFYYVGDRLVKSVIFQTLVKESLSEAGEAPEPYRAWTDEVLSAGANAVMAKDAIKGMSVSSETLSEESVASVSKTYVDGHLHLTFSIPRGQPGENGTDGVDGYTPQRGVDYFTEGDVAYFEGYIDDRMGGVDEALDAIIEIQNDLIGGESA